MVSLRYHIVTIMAVFLALGIGLVVGSTFIDSVLLASLQQQVDQQELDTASAKEQRDVALAEGEQIRIDADATVQMWVELTRRYTASGQFDGQTVLIVAPQGVDRAVIDPLVQRIGQSRARNAGVLWIQDGFRPSQVAARSLIAEALSLPYDNEVAVRSALRTLLPQALFTPRPVDLVGSGGGEGVASGGGEGVASAGGSGGGEGVRAGGSGEGVQAGGGEQVAEAPEPGVLSVLAEIGLLLHEPATEGDEVLTLDNIASPGMLVLVVTDAASGELNNDFIFPLLRDIVVTGHSGTAVVVEVGPTLATDAAGGVAGNAAGGVAGNAAGGVTNNATGDVLEQVRGDRRLRDAFSTVESNIGPYSTLTTLMALIELPTVTHYRAIAPWEVLEKLETSDVLDDPAASGSTSN